MGYRAKGLSGNETLPFFPSLARRLLSPSFVLPTEMGLLTPELLSLILER